MARRGKQPDPPNHERWLVSYADFVTLLFAFFVVMFATSQGDKTKTKAVSESVKAALENGHMSAMIEALLRKDKEKPTEKDNPWTNTRPDSKKDAPPAELVPSYAHLQKELAKEIQEGKIQVRLEARGLVVSLREASFYSSGDDRVYAEGMPTLDKLAEAMQRIDNPVRLEGHTDAVPIHTARFNSNWDLSAARSIAMLKFFTEKHSLPAWRFAVAGYAETAPVDTNASVEGRARNRRVDIVILTAAGQVAEPLGHNKKGSTNGQD